WFNSSIADLMNMWFRGFYSIIYKMHKDHYNFFLDEMIRQQNSIIINSLYFCGVICYKIPYSYLLA
ncbi:hypothetical protein HETIRDRAFT_318718, partial [Heterobasidion irregulare TC 32-1]